jgi:hypothetical protein
MKRSSNPPTLADAAILSSIEQRFGRRPPQQAYAAMLREVAKARKIVLDDNMSCFLADLWLNTRKGGLRHRLRRLENTRQFARLPHKLTWIEYPFAPFGERLKSFGVRVGKHGVGPMPERYGWLVRQHSRNDAAFIAHEFRSMVTKPSWAFLHPIASAWCTDDSASPWPRFPPREGMAFMLPEDGPWETLSSAAAAGMPGYRSTQAHYSSGVLGIQGVAELVSSMVTPDLSDEEKRATTQPVVALRVLWGLLATINDLPTVVEMISPTTGYMVRGKYRSYMEHSVIHLTVPQTEFRRLMHKLAAQLRRRAHQVRGHWRNDHRSPLHIGCLHDYNGEMICRLCGGHKIWVKEHQRGDASIGFVTHDYEVHRGNRDG